MKSFIIPGPKTAPAAAPKPKPCRKPAPNSLILRPSGARMAPTMPPTKPVSSPVIIAPVIRGCSKASTPILAAILFNDGISVSTPRHIMVDPVRQPPPAETMTASPLTVLHPSIVYNTFPGKPLKKERTAHRRCPPAHGSRTYVC